MSTPTNAQLWELAANGEKESHRQYALDTLGERIHALKTENERLRLERDKFKVRASSR